MTVWMWIRATNGLLAAFSFAILILRLRRWVNLDRVFRMYWLALLAFLVVTVEGQTEQIIQHTQPGPRTVLATIALIWCAVAAISSLRAHRTPKGKS